MSDFTKGPWEWILPREWDSEMPILTSSNGEMVCSFGDSEMYYPTEGTPPNKEDMKLIASAPDLFYALNGVIDLYTSLVNSTDCGFWDPEQVEEIKAAREAIKKVTE